MITKPATLRKQNASPFAPESSKPPKFTSRHAREIFRRAQGHAACQRCMKPFAPTITRRNVRMQSPARPAFLIQMNRTQEDFPLSGTPIIQISFTGASLYVIPTVDPPDKKSTGVRDSVRASQSRATKSRPPLSSVRNDPGSKQTEAGQPARQAEGQPSGQTARLLGRHVTLNKYTPENHGKTGTARK